MGTDITPTGRYVVVCDVCGCGTDTGAWRQEDAWWTAASHGWLIWTDRGDQCAECAERWQEAHQAAAVPLQDPVSAR